MTSGCGPSKKYKFDIFYVFMHEHSLGNSNIIIIVIALDPI